MNTLDIIILLCFIPAVLSGIRRGFIEQAVALVSVVLGAWLAFKFSTMVGDWLHPYLDVSETVLHTIAFALILIVVVIILFLIGRMMTGVAKLVMLGWLDRILGIVFSLVKAWLIIGLLVILFDTLNVKFEMVDNSLLESSVLYGPLRDISYMVFPYLKELLLKQ